MRIGLISESPTVSTGFGVNARHLVRLLAELGHTTVVFGVCGEGARFNGADYPCQIIPMPRDQFDALPLLPAFLAEQKPDVLLVHYDIAAVKRFVDAARATGWTGPVIVHYVADGLPMRADFVRLLASVQASITPTQFAADDAIGRGIQTVFAAPHPVDTTVFRQLPSRAALRAGAGLEDVFMVGVFGRNTERKQQPRVLMALRRLSATNVGVYFHCQPRNEDSWMNGWDLPEVAQHIGVLARVRFPDPGFRQLTGVEYSPRLAPGRVPDSPSGLGRDWSIPSAYSYVERLNCCDMVVNVPFSGAFELIALEAQACGVPLAITDDEGAMREVVGETAILLPAVDIGIHSSGAKQHFVAPKTIADAIRRVKGDADLRERLTQQGLENAARHTLEPLRRALRAALALAS